MAFCSHCGNKLNPGDRFCGKCGKPVSGGGGNHNADRQAFNDFVPGGKTPEGQKALKAILDKKSARAMTFYWLSVFVGIVLAVSLLTWVFIEGDDAGVMQKLLAGAFLLSPFAIMYIALCSIIISSMRAFRKFDYINLPGVKDSQGNHRCFFCGNKGVYKHTPYKTNSTLADCSKCGERLWVE